MDKLLSFIIPVYNVEAYLPQCLDSILSQFSPQCEMILVDDGARDSSGEICDTYAGRFSGIRVIHKENGGLSSARNAGMEIAAGEYVCFVDSDDYIEPETASRLLDWIQTGGGDICFLQTRKVYPDGSWEPMGEGLDRDSIRGKSREQVLEFLSTRSKFPASAWGKLLRREFLIEKGLRFPDDRRLSEDLSYCLDAFLAAERFDVLEFPFYCYRQNREGSITHRVNARHSLDAALFVEDVARRFPLEREDMAAVCARSFGAYEYAIRLWEVTRLSGEDRKQLMNFLQTYRWILRCGKSQKTKWINSLVSLMGLRAASAILGVYMNIRK